VWSKELNTESADGLILAIDTSTRLTSTALYRGGLVAEYNWQTHDDHTRELLPAVDRMLTQEGARVTDLSGIAVALGPGSFNGLRVGVSTAKALALPLQMPVVGIGTLEASAYQHAGVPMQIRPLLNAGRGQINTALFAGAVDDWRQIEPPEAISLEDLIARIHEPVFVCGEVEPGWAAELRHHLGNLVYLPAVAGRARRAAFLAELGWKRLRLGEADDVTSLQPIYLRKPAITQSRRPLRPTEECR
jgi:tRNA threonylcarbamoyladenosine biosynthesis protein TsaB